MHFPTALDMEDFGGSFKEMYDSSDKAVLLVRPQADRIVDANQRACKALGYKRNELLRRHVSDIHPEDMPRLLSFSDSVLRAGQGQTDELSCLTRTGNRIAASITASRIDTGQGVCMLAVMHPRDAGDLPPHPRPLSLPGAVATGVGTHRRATPAFSSLASEATDRFILDCISDAVILLAPEGRIEFVNRAAADLLDNISQRLEHGDVRSLLPPFANWLDAALVSPFPASSPPGGISSSGTTLFARYHPRLIDGKPLGGIITLHPAETDARHLARQPAQLAVQGLNFPADPESRIIGNSPAMRRVAEQIALVSATDTNVLITGETGTGKDLVARAIHRASRRARRPFVRVNCTALHRELFESELFGHVRGAFTGAVSDRAGRFELADGGTLFLDEIGDLPLESQSKLLTAIQERTFERVGEGRPRGANVRIVAATNMDLARAVSTGTFRTDLYYRLNVFPIRLPSLRERREDIPLIASHVVASCSARLGRPARDLNREEVSRLTAYHWPGNVRELQNVIERAMIRAVDGRPFHLDPSDDSGAQACAISLQVTGVLTDDERRQRDRENILQALRSTDGRVGGPDGAAALLGVKPTTLRSRIKALGIKSRTEIDVVDPPPHNAQG
jgi:formate hydrogenlyase transcriptional activator